MWAARDDAVMNAPGTGRACAVVLASAAGALALAACASSAATNADAGAARAGTWSAGPPLPIARFEAYAAVAGGKAYFLGGITGDAADIATAASSRRVDVLDPASGTWSPGPDLPADAPKHHLAVAVWQDAIYVVGGFDGVLGQHENEPFRPIAAAYVLERGATTWRALAPPPFAHGAATAQAIDGKIYVAGGAPTEDQPPYADLDVYDIAANAWSKGPPMPTAREHLASCAVDGRLITIGGWVGAGRVAQKATESFDPRTNAWSVAAPMPTARGGLAATAIGSECHVVGGEDWTLALPGTLGAHEVFDARSGAWSTRAAMPTARHGLGLAWLDAGARLYAIGGGPSQGNAYTAVVEVFAP